MLGFRDAYLAVMLQEETTKQIDELLMLWSFLNMEAQCNSICWSLEIVQIYY